jgi:hypothetical protein
MTANRKIVQLSLITIGAFLILATYFFYPTIKESKLRVETSKEKINVQEEIKILEEKQQTLIDQIQEKKEYLSSGGVLKKGTLENLQIDLQKTSSSLAEKKSALEKHEKVTSTDNVDESNIFENVEYKGFFKIDSPFTVKSEKARIAAEDPDIVHLSEMSVTLYLKNGKDVVITADEGKYNKTSYDIYFVGNVVGRDGETIITSENLDLLASEDIAIIYNNVRLNSNKNSLQADKVEYDFETKFYRISMFDDTRVKIKLIE